MTSMKNRRLLSCRILRWNLRLFGAKKVTSNQCVLRGLSNGMNEGLKSNVLGQQIQTAWDFVFEKLYYPKTHMFYDYLTGNSIEETLDSFPTAEEIKASSPNPCGWRTGMEDSTLNACPMIEAIITRYKLTKDPEMKTYADMVYEGLLLNGTISTEPGFIARSVSPVDGKSFYMDSSRDQYTNWVYAAHLLMHSELMDDTQKMALKEVLVHIAKKAERDVKPENRGCMLRMDGKPGLVSCLDSEKLEAHELLRLPMIYLAAYEVSSEKHWKEKYHEVRERLLTWAEQKNTSEILWNKAHWGYIFGIYQSMYSLRLLYDLEEDDAYRSRYLRLMQLVAEASLEAVRVAYEQIDEITDGEDVYPCWRKRPAGNYIFHYGYNYYMPQVYLNEKMNKYLRNVPEALIIQCICPEFEIPQWELDMFYEFVERLDFSQAKAFWPILFCDAWWLLQIKTNR